MEFRAHSFKWRGSGTEAVAEAALGSFRQNCTCDGLDTPTASFILLLAVMSGAPTVIASDVYNSVRAARRLRVATW